MSIRLIARELYTLSQAVDALEKKLADAPLDKRVTLDRQLQKARSELDRMRNILDGRIDRQ